MLLNFAQVAVEMGDDSHGRKHLHTVALPPYGAHPERQQPWYEAAMARLFDGEVHAVIWGLQRMKPTDAHAAEETDPLVQYLQLHQELLDDRLACKGA